MLLPNLNLLDKLLDNRDFRELYKYFHGVEVFMWETREKVSKETLNHGYTRYSTVFDFDIMIRVEMFCEQAIETLKNRIEDSSYEFFEKQREAMNISYLYGVLASIKDIRAIAKENDELVKRYIFGI